jgi:hypothetical protein
MELEDYILKEREFLHDLSNQLVIAEGMLGVTFPKLSLSSPPTQMDLERAEKALNSMRKIKDLLVERKSTVVTIHEALKL